MGTEVGAPGARPTAHEIPPPSTKVSMAESAPNVASLAAPESLGVPPSVPASDAASHVCVVVLQLGVPGFVQSALTLHPPMGTQVPSALQVLERQTLVALLDVHGPWPLA